MGRSKTAAELAAKYKTAPAPRCYVCKMEPEKVAVVRALRYEHGMSFPQIARAMSEEFGVTACPGAIQQHFANHERRAA